jgi:hypothetical protein
MSRMTDWLKTTLQHWVDLVTGKHDKLEGVRVKLLGRLSSGLYLAKEQSYSFRQLLVHIINVGNC